MGQIGHPSLGQLAQTPNVDVSAEGNGASRSMQDGILQPSKCNETLYTLVRYKWAVAKLSYIEIYAVFIYLKKSMSDKMYNKYCKLYWYYYKITPLQQQQPTSHSHPYT